MTYKEFKETGVTKYMPNGFELYGYDCDSDLLSQDELIPTGNEYDNWFIRYIGGGKDLCLAAVYISKSENS